MKLLRKKNAMATHYVYYDIFEDKICELDGENHEFVCSLAHVDIKNHVLFRYYDGSLYSTPIIFLDEWYEFHSEEQTK